MKISSMITVLFLMIHSGTVHAMDNTHLIKYEQYKQPLHIKTIQDIPKKSFENIKTYISNNKSTCKFIELEKGLYDSFTFNVALLPHELRFKIITIMFGGDEISATMFYKTPLLYACKRYQDAKSTILNSTMSKDLLDKKIAEFFKLSAEKQDKIISVINPSLFEIIDGGSALLSYDTLQVIEQDTAVSLFLKGHEVRLGTIEEEKKVGCFLMKKLFFSTMLSLILSVALPTIFIDGFICQLDNKCTYPLVDSFYYHSYSIFAGTMCCAFIAPSVLTRYCCMLKRKI